MPYSVEVEDTEDNNGERGTYMLRTKSDLSVGGDVIGGSIHNGKGAKVDIDADYPTVGRTVRSSKRSRSKCRKCRKKCHKKVRSECGQKCNGWIRCWEDCKSEIMKTVSQNVRKNVGQRMNILSYMIPQVMSLKTPSTTVNK